MEIKYRILSVDEKEHSFVVRYYTDLLTEDYLTSFYNDDGSIRRGPDGTPARCRSDFNLTMYKTDATQEEIEKQIKISAPADWFKMLEHMMQNDTTTSLQNLKEKIAKENSFIHEPPPIFQPILGTTDEAPPAISEAEVASFIARLKNA